MTYRDASTLSAGAVEKAKREGRFVAGRVYGTQKQASQARAARKNGGRVKTGGPSEVRATGRVTEVVMMELKLKVDETEVFGAFNLNGKEADQRLHAFRKRNTRILGARLEVKFPLTRAATRWSVATVHKLSPGKKSVRQVAGVRGAQNFDTALFVDKWLTINDVQCDLYKVGEDGSELLSDDEMRHVVFALETEASWGSQEVELVLHLTVQLDAVAIATTDL